LDNFYVRGRRGAFNPCFSVDNEPFTKIMKKTRFFIALIALCCVLISQADKTYAVSDLFSIFQDGRLGAPYNWYIVPEFAHSAGDACSHEFYRGFYPDTSHPLTGGTNSCGDIVLYPDYTMNLGVNASYTDYWYMLTDSTTATDFFYYPINYDFDMSTWYVSTGQHVSITSPALGSVATSTADYLTGTWTGIDPDIYENLTLYFTANYTGESGTPKLISVASGSGSFSIPLRDFGITSNGRWDLKTNATFKNTQLSDMYITHDLTTGYYLTLDVPGLHTPYVFTDWATWYTANVSDYDTPTAWATAMVGYIQPILQKIAEFGARVQDYLDVSTAYQRGNDFGAVFPVVGAYVDKVNLFFGGFPIVAVFQWGILIMMGLFAVKIIFKFLSFIPFFGGGG